MKDDLASLGALDEPNRRRLYELVVATGELGRERAADELGISRELAAFHLDRLVDAGLLEASYRRLSGRAGPGAGRPAKLYRRAAAELSVTLPPRRYESIASVFAAGLDGISAEVEPGLVGRAMADPARAAGHRAGMTV